MYSLETYTNKFSNVFILFLSLPSQEKCTHPFDSDTSHGIPNTSGSHKPQNECTRRMGFHGKKRLNLIFDINERGEGQ